MVKIIKRAGLAISKEFENETFYKNIKEFLCRRTKVYNSSVYTYNIFYLEGDKYLTIPRNFPIYKYIIPDSIINKQHEGQDIEIQHNITPRNELQEKAINIMLENETLIFQLMPGVGKTVISIFMIATRKKKSIVLVHRDSLAEQWKDRLLSFTNLKENDIARLTSPTFMKDLQKPIIISTVQTFLSLLKRNREKFLVELDKANIGIFIADEVHTSVGAPTFSECSIHIPAKYVYGLSATPYRFDGNGDIIQYHLGKIISDDDLGGTMSSKVTVILVDYQIDTPFRYKYIHWGGEFQRSRYLTMMKKSEQFLDTLKALISTFKKDRNVLCMAERIKLIEELYKWTPTRNKSMFCGSETLDKLNYQVTYATPGKCRDGIDAPQKDCVIMTSPISNLEQLTGRVVRTVPGKKTPIIIDMVDYGSRDIAQTLRPRLNFYEKKGWPVQFVLVLNGNKRIITKDDALKLISGGIIDAP